MEGPVDLGASLEEYVEQLVSEGGFASREDVIREGVLMMQERQRAAAHAELEASLRRGLEDAKAGRVRDLDEVADELCAEYQAMADARIKA